MWVKVTVTSSDELSREGAAARSVCVGAAVGAAFPEKSIQAVAVSASSVEAEVTARAADSGDEADYNSDYDLRV